jgi:hypothetical protein
MVEHIGFEPMTSSMPWKRASRAAPMPHIFTISVRYRFSCFNGGGDAGDHHDLTYRDGHDTNGLRHALCRVK